MNAQDIMTKNVITLTPDMSVDAAQEILLRYRIHGAPIVDAAGQLIGMVSFLDLLARSGERVRDVMTPDPVSASEDTPLEQIAAMMLDHMVRRLTVVRDGRVMGIVSASDIVQLFLNLHESVRSPRRAQA